MKYFIPVFLSLISFIAAAQQRQKVLIIGIDGCRPDAMALANTPNLDALIANGIFSPDALNDDITISGPGWSAILCGVWSAKHLVTGNNFTGNNYDNYPPLFYHLNLFNPAFNTASICHWAPINDYIVQDYADYKLNVSTDQEVSTQASNYITQNDPDLLFLHFDDVDHAGHSSGFTPDSPNYIAAIEGVDNFIGPVLLSIEQRPDYANEDWLIIVTTDHGGNGFGHGGNTIEEQNVFVIASGNDIPSSVITKESMVIDNNIFNCLGESEALRFDGAGDYVQIPADPSFNFGASQDFTIECRVLTSVSADVAIVGNKNWASGLNKGFVLSFKYPSGPEWKVNIGDGSSRADLNTGGAIADNEWHTLSVSFDRDGLMKMYQDGNLTASTDISFVGDINTNQGLFLGADINGAFGYSGSIAEVRVWNTIIEGNSINTWHCNPIDNTHPNFANLIGYWRLNEGTGTTQAIDHAGTHHGTIQGAVWNDPGMTIVDDYSLTPRLTDILPTALTHFCAPLKPEWNLDGSSLITSPCLLPVTLTSFRGWPLDQSVQLQWKTSSEKANAGFYVEHSRDGINFSEVGFVSGLGNAYTEHQYKFVHQTPDPGSNYYRLKQVDEDGLFAYSEMIQLLFNPNATTFQVYPTVVHDYLNIIIQKQAKEETFQIFYENGEIAEKINLQQNQNRIDVSHLPPGIFFLQKNGTDTVLKFIKY